MVNQVTLIGNVTRDPEVRQTPTGKQVANFGVATHRKSRDQETGEIVDRTEFHECVAWGRNAENAQKILKKGRQTYVLGSLKTDHWEKDGQKRSVTRIVVDEFRVLDKPKGQPEPDEGD